MTINSRAARALRDARTRLRDIAAADHANQSAARDRAADRVAAEREIFASQITRAANDLGGARSIYQLSLVADLLDEQSGVIASVSRAQAEAQTSADAAAAKLRDRTRQLRTAEKLVEIAKTERDTHDAKAEQRSSDDLVGARMK
jgi:flagellar export protein FliJ